MTTYGGGCACGAIRYEIAAEPLYAFQCQCRSCQQFTGTGHASVMVFPEAAIRVTGEVREFARPAESGAQTVMGFCGTCGSGLYGRRAANPDTIGVLVGSLDEPQHFKPQAALFASRGHAWDRLDPALPKLPGMPQP
ncbi:MAG TPA: GFA family protein [Alphaproteobacteria bacterium]